MKYTLALVLGMGVLTGFTALATRGALDDEHERGLAEGRAEREAQVEQMRQECIQRGRECGEMQAARLVIDCFAVCDALATEAP